MSVTLAYNIPKVKGQNGHSQIISCDVPHTYMSYLSVKLTRQYLPNIYKG